jgi:predicted MFS family arabinose efflux permease
MVCTACITAELTALLPILPIAVHHVSRTTAGLGVVTGGLAVGTVMLELGTPWVLERWPLRQAFAGGFAATGVALLGLATLPALPVMVLLGVLFGMGFGLTVTASSTVVGRLGDTPRRGGALTLYSLAGGIPMIVAPTLALVALPRIHISGTFVACAVPASIGLLAAIAVPATEPPASDRVRFRSLLLNGHLPLVVAAYACVMVAAGAVISFAPLAITGDGLGSVAAFFLVFGLFRLVGRSGAAARLSRVTGSRMFLPSVVCCAIGLGCLAIGTLSTDLIAAIVFGFGLGALQTASFVVMLDREPLAVAGSVTSMWNVATDGSTDVGALSLAPVAAAVGYRSMFAVVSGIALVAVGLSVVDSRARAQSESEHRPSGT